MKRQILSRPAKLVVFASFSLMLSAQLQAAPPSILDDPAMAPGGSILLDPTARCGPGQAEAFTPGVDAYGNPVAPADSTAPVVLGVGDQPVFAEVKTANPMLNNVTVPVAILGGLDQGQGCVPQPRPNRRQH